MRIQNCLILTVVLGISVAYSPISWSLVNGIGGRMLLGFPDWTTPAWRSFAIVLLVAKQAKETIWEITDNCKEQNGKSVDRMACSGSVIDSVIGAGIATCSYKGVKPWNKREEEDLFANIPNVISVYDSHSMKREEADIHLASFTPDGFRGVKFRDGKTNSVIAMATNGSNHLIQTTGNLDNWMINNTHKRNGINGYVEYTGYSLEVLCNSDSSGTWNNAVTWANTKSGSQTPNEQIQCAMKEGCRTYPNIIDDTFGIAMAEGQASVGGLNPQFIVKVTKGYANTGWISGMNWCFGAYKTNC